jgi:coenzyme F420-reducing hydrogenase delta subunit
MCTGRISQEMILRAFEKGAGMVLVGGCHPPGDCHYIDGNIQCEEMLKKIKEKVLPGKGIDPDRLRLEWVSSAEGTVFQKVMTEMSGQLAALGPAAAGLAAGGPETQKVD